MSKFEYLTVDFDPSANPKIRDDLLNCFGDWTLITVVPVGGLSNMMIAFFKRVLPQSSQDSVIEKIELPQEHHKRRGKTKNETTG